MKRQYIQPATAHIKVELQQMIADSFSKLSTDVEEDDARSKSNDFFTEEEAAWKNEYPAFSLWED